MIFIKMIFLKNFVILYSVLVVSAEVDTDVNQKSYAKDRMSSELEMDSAAVPPQTDLTSAPHTSSFRRRSHPHYNDRGYDDGYWSKSVYEEQAEAARAKIYRSVTGKFGPNGIFHPTVYEHRSGDDSINPTATETLLRSPYVAASNYYNPLLAQQQLINNMEANKMTEPRGILPIGESLSSMRSSSKTRDLPKYSDINRQGNYANNQPLSTAFTNNQPTNLYYAQQRNLNQYAPNQVAYEIRQLDPHQHQQPHGHHNYPVNYQLNRAIQPNVYAYYDPQAYNVPTNGQRHNYLVNPISPYQNSQYGQFVPVSQGIGYHQHESHPVSNSRESNPYANSYQSIPTTNYGHVNPDHFSSNYAVPYPNGNQISYQPYATQNQIQSRFPNSNPIYVQIPPPINTNPVEYSRSGSPGLLAIGTSSQTLREKNSYSSNGHNDQKDDEHSDRSSGHYNSSPSLNTNLHRSFNRRVDFDDELEKNNGRKVDVKVKNSTNQH